MSLRTLSYRLKQLLRPTVNRHLSNNSTKIGGGKNHISIYNCNRIKNSNFIVTGENNELIIEDGCYISGLNVLMGEGSKIIIRSGTTINASSLFPVVINALERTSIIIEKNCLFSNSIEIHSTDYHSILADDGHRINRAADIHIGEHTWVGLRATILKGVTLQQNTIVAANSVVTRSFTEPNIIIAGNPAQKVKTFSRWLHERI